MTTADPDPYRADAALVYRFLRDHGPATAPNIALHLFPGASEGPDSSLAAIRRMSLRRVYDSVVWMRHQGVLITAVPAYGPGEGSVFHLGAVEIRVLEVYRVGAWSPDAEFVTDEVSNAPETLSESMDVWHGG